MRRLRAARRNEDGAALLMVLLLIMIAAAISLLLLGMVISQAAPTIRERKLARTLHAAEAGINVAQSQIKAATTADALGVLRGDRSKLPCGTITGTVGGEAGNVGYSVIIRYYIADPANTAAAWRTANALPCVSGYGPQQVPRYALMEAKGSGDSAAGTSPASGNRSLEAVYTIRVTNAHLAGGLIKNMYGGTGGNLALCFDAMSSTPVADAPLNVTTCDSTSAAQVFAYQTNFSIVLTATQTTATPAGMCVTYDPAKPTLVMRSCDDSDSQKWGFDGTAHFRWPWNGGVCMMIQTDNTSGSHLVANASACNTSYDRQYTWEPAAEVGAGDAGPNQNQFVNYREFGRCFDVTGQHVTATYLIDWPCKQDPTAPPKWNQQLSYDAGTGHLISNSTYCVTSPVTTGAYIVLQPCVTGQADQRWTLSGDTGVYATSYNVIDYLGRCMDLGPPDAGLPQWSTIVPEVCDGSTSQKWNAPADLIDAATRNTRETTGQ
ncbi:MAG TPA: ricin-type beta-trefoil lectin domain protein [Kineosporiaceae bacterium]